MKNKLRASITALPVVCLLATFITIALPQISQASAKGIDAIDVCMDFGCKRLDVVSLGDAEWAEVVGWFEDARTAEEEREQLKKAIGWMEVIIGKHTPTHKDIGGNLTKEGKADFPGQLDCIDESRNTTTYLSLFADNGYLKHHVVMERAYRKAMFDQHWSGQIREKATGQRYVVDSWFQNNGDLPYVQKSEKWEDIPALTSFLDNSQPNPEFDNSLLGRLLGRNKSQ